MDDQEDPLRLPSEEFTIKTETCDSDIDVNQYLSIKQEDEESQSLVVEIGKDEMNKRKSKVVVGGEDSNSETDQPSERKRTRKGKQYNTKKPREKKINGKYFCDTCQFKTVYLHALKIHKAVHSEEKPFKCNQCDYKTKFATSLRRHTTHQHEKHEPDLMCDKCDYKTAFASNLRMHMKIHFKEQCYKCLRKFDKDVMQAHLLWCGSNIFVPNGNSLGPNGSVLVGNEPDGNFVDAGVFAPTCELVEGEEVLDIDQNNGGQPNLSPVRIQSDDGTTFYMCDKCDYMSTYRKSCKGHMRIHYDDKPFKCSFESCNFETKYENALATHKLTHITKDEIDAGSVQYYNCNLCDYKSLYKNNLKIHERKHSVDKKYKCNVCDFKTAHPTSYRKHQRMHQRKILEGSLTKGKFECAKCDFETSYAGRLDYHMLKCHHEVAIGFQNCPHCVFATREKWRLTVHLGRSKVAEVLKCPHCDFETNFKCQFRAHKKRHIVVHDVSLPKICRNLTPMKKQTNFYRDPNVNDPNTDILNNKGSKILVKENKSLDKPFSCFQCDFSSKHKCGVQKHYRRRHLQLLPFDCEKCSFATKTKDALQLHVKRSKVEKVIVCECGFESLFKCELIQHQKIHDSFRCDQCTYSCKKIYDFEKHLVKMHNGLAGSGEVASTS